MTCDRKREFNFTDKEFKFLTELVFNKTGIVLKNSKFEMVYSRLARRLRKLGLNKFKEYVQLLQGSKGEDELAYLVDAITTNLTKFFRESHQFKDLIKNVLDQAIEAAKAGKPRKLRIWSAGCSGGQEAYSLAMILASYIKDFQNWDVMILASDIDRNMLNKGREAIYSVEELESLPENFSKRFVSKDKYGQFSIDPELRKIVHFKSLNLLHEWPMKSKFDAIFCRNVVIYFDNETKEDLVSRFSDKLKNNGMLYLGHSESAIGINESLTLAGRASFRKVS
tara:strand:+ start:5413 stop:6255 length:843 start_codon:yes stop_codon:yes gene_type:complete